MHSEKIKLEDTGFFSKLFLDYLGNNPDLKSFYKYRPEGAAFGKVLKDRNFEKGSRQMLMEVLDAQYADINRGDAVSENIRKLGDEKTFTVTTGHQLNIFTGPLFFIFKIITVINTCKKLKELHPDYHFIPVYWMASEDHDIEEIRSFTLFGNTYSWETDQEGPVGRMDPSSIKSLFEKLPEKLPVFEKAYSGFSTLSGSVRYYINEIFGKEGLIVLDADDKKLKEIFKPVIKDDLTNHHANDMVENTSSKLAEMNYTTQVYPRAINLFYMDKGKRGRIVHEEGRYKILDTDWSFSQDELMSIVDTNPENFSPNVILRPVYQEMVLPNIAYIGGPAEVAYWLQLKDVFDFYKISFPVVFPRNFGMILGKSLVRKLSKLMIDGQDLFMDLNDLKKKHLKEQSEHSFNLESEREVAKELFESVKNKTRAVDKSLEGFIGAEETKLFKSLDNIEKRLTKAEENKQETSINQIKSLKDKLFPDGNLQERVECYLSFSLNDPDFIPSLIRIFDPFDFRFNMIYED